MPLARRRRARGVRRRDAAPRSPPGASRASSATARSRAPRSPLELARVRRVLRPGGRSRSRRAGTAAYGADPGQRRRACWSTAPVSRSRPQRLQGVSVDADAQVDGATAPRIKQSAFGGDEERYRAQLLRTGHDRRGRARGDPDRSCSPTRCVGQAVRRPARVDTTRRASNPPERPDAAATLHRLMRRLSLLLLALPLVLLAAACGGGGGGSGAASPRTTPRSSAATTSRATTLDRRMHAGEVQLRPPEAHVPEGRLGRVPGDPEADPPEPRPARRARAEGARAWA